MAEFTYNNPKNTSINHMLFDFNCEYYLRFLFKHKIDFYFKSHFTNKLAEELNRFFIYKSCRKMFIITK